MLNKINSNFKKSKDETDWKSQTIITPRHRWYNYKEGFSPKVVERAIEEAGVKSKDIVIDPFNGAGTTTLTCSIKGINSIGIEVNPFSKFVSSAKQERISLRNLDKQTATILKAIQQGRQSKLLKFSTFTEEGNNRGKWLFNSGVLNAFEGGRQLTNSMPSAYKNVFTLALISAAMETSNAAKDGKCLKYKKNWETLKHDKYSFLDSFQKKISSIRDDIKVIPCVNSKAQLLSGDCRLILEKKIIKEGYKLCITSPPYLNSFDYTDIYRPELFLGEFINSNEELNLLRQRTLRSHVEIKLKVPFKSDFGSIYQDTIKKILSEKDNLWDKQIPIMIQAYFEDMESILCNLKEKASNDAQIWIVVSNSAYAGIEIPVDLIIADIGSKLGLFLKEIGVLRYVNKRKSKNSIGIDYLRESVIIFSKNK